MCTDSKDCDRLRARVTELEQVAGDRGDRLEDWEEERMRVLADECSPNERHCTCVPHLRARVAELERDRDEADDAWRELMRQNLAAARRKALEEAEDALEGLSGVAVCPGWLAAAQVVRALAEEKTGATSTILPGTLRYPDDGWTALTD